MRIHGVPPRGEDRVPLSPISDGRFGRMFRRLPPAPVCEDPVLEELASGMKEDAGENSGSWGQPNAQPVGGDNDKIPAAYTYFGQFIDHDITFDPASDLQRLNDPDALVDFRTPRFDLDSVYGSGPADEPFQYDQDPAKPGRLLLGPSTGGELDLPRNGQDVALIGDPRNDENKIVSQLQLVFLRLHNKLADQVDADPAVPPERKFEETQRLVRWHYQWVVVHDYLDRTCGEPLMRQLFPTDETSRLPKMNRDYYHPKKNAYMPVEFSVAAFRFGHSQIRAAYNLNSDITNIPLFVAGDDVAPIADLRGGMSLPTGWSNDWGMFLPIAGSTPQPSRLIDTHLTPALFDLPRFPSEQPQSLAFRNLKRAQALQLPSGQDVARYLRTPTVLSGADLGGVVDPTPLWFYILKESEVTADDEGNSGAQLGPVGARIVAEVLLGLLDGDPLSYFNVERRWVPTLPAADTSVGFTLADLVAFAIS